MVYITRREKKGKYYLYLEESARINGKPRRVWQKYLGPEERLAELNLSGLFSKHSTHVEIQTFEFGISAALWQIANKIGLATIIDSLTNKKREQGLSVGEYITIAAINRCAQPCTKTNLGQWFQTDWLSNQYEISPETLNAQTYWNHFQYFDENTLEKIEIALNQTVISQYALDLDSLFYDPTNFFTFSAGTGENGLLQFGHSKENRNGNRLVSYTLLCARESGIPIMHKTYPGNEQDSKRFKTVPGEIHQRLQLLGQDPTQVTLVFDKGNHSTEAFQAIEASKIGFIASIRNSTQKDLLHIPEHQLTELFLPISGKMVKYTKTKREIYGHERTIYVVLDSKKAQKHKTHFDEKLQEILDVLQEFISTKLNKKKWRNKDAVEKKVKNLIGRKPFKEIVEYDLSGMEEALILKIKCNEMARVHYVETLGRTLLFTNRDEWEPEAVIWGYREQYIVEHAFRNMKCPTSIKIRPMYHYSDRSVRCHVFVCVLSLLLLSLLRLTLSRQSLPMSYTELLNQLKTVHVLKILTSSQGTPIWKLDQGAVSAQKLVQKLKLKNLV